MGDSPAAGRERQLDPRPSPSDAAPAEAAANAAEIAGVVSETAGTRSGEDVRRRGWFWHWNSIVTQYAPLIGLKGVGLLNSYTVWTDRREESPTRGYAFPSQQSEADFYGEDRAELITINKLLVALDLIEIRKEMVLRADEQGRRWRVPHNFYRVKDHGDGFHLTSADVLRAAELAERDQAVYRYIRRVFSPRFAPIDRANVWTQILAEVRLSPVWQRLGERAARDEQRASERTRAGHAARKEKGRATPERAGQDRAAGHDGHFLRPAVLTPKQGNDSDPGAIEETAETSVGDTNKGFEVDVAPANTGSTAEIATSVAGANSALPTDVGQFNRTYDQPRLTTTTTGKPREMSSAGDPDQRVDTAGAVSQRPVTTPAELVTGRGIGPCGRPAAADAPGEAAAIRAFEDANGRPSTPAERHLLRGLAERFAPAAAERRESGWSWVTAAIYEAVEAGSAYVAPRRLREILGRWEREGVPGESARQRGTGAGRTVRPNALADELGEAPEVELPHGIGSRQTWAFVVSLLRGAVEPERLAELVRGTAIVAYAPGEVTISAPDRRQAERLAGEYGELVSRKLSEALRRPVRIAVVTLADGADDAGVAPGEAPPVRRTVGNPNLNRPVMEEEAEPEPPVFIVEECGLPNAQVWAAVLDEVARRGGIGTGDFEAWLRPTRLIGRGAGEDRSLVIGVSHALAKRRIEGRFAAPLAAAAAEILGRRCPLQFVVAREWLLAHPPAPGNTSNAAFG